MRWRLLMEEYDLTFHYIKGEKNVVADALSRLVASESAMEDDTVNLIEDAFEISNADWRRFYQPLTIAEIGKFQKNDPYVQRLQQESPERLGELFEDIGKKAGADFVITETNVVDKKQRIIVPRALAPRLMAWYRTIPCWYIRELKDCITL